jgi:hypothetical protein
MFKKRVENTKFSEERALLIQFLDLQTDEYIKKFIQENYKAGQHVSVASTGTAGGLRVRIVDDRVDISRTSGYTKIYIGVAKVWDNEQTKGDKFKGKARLAKIVP